MMFNIIELFLLLIQASGKPIMPRINPYMGIHMDNMPSTNPAV